MEQKERYNSLEIHKMDASLKKLLPPEKIRAGIKYIPSQFALPFEHNEKQYVFNTLTKQCLKTELPESAAAGEEYDPLIEGRFLVPENKDECAYYNSVTSILRTYRRKKGIKTYTILPTLRCNARCTYCYEQGREQGTMTPEIVEQTIRFILDTRRADKVNFTWFGGEPLLGEETIDRICEGMRQAGASYSSFVVSNGSLITPRVAAKMKEIWNVKKIQISVDGAESDYIRRKRYASYHDYYHAVMKSVGELSEAGIHVSVRCNVDENNWERIQEFVNDMAAGVLHKSNVTIYFSPLDYVRAGENDLAMWKKIVEARSIVESAGFHTFTMHSNGLELRVHHCMADAGSVVITPDGGLYACEHCTPESRFGDIWNGVTDEPARYAFCRTDRTREKCRACTYLPICTNFAACPAVDAHCREMMRMITVDMLKRLVDKKGIETSEDSMIC